MSLRTQAQTKAVGIVVSLGLLGLVGYVDYATGYEISLLVFYLLPILFGLRHVGTGFAFVLAVFSGLTCFWAAYAAGQHFHDVLTPIWNTAISTTIFLLVVILFSNRDYLRRLADQQVEKLRHGVEERTRLEKELLEIAESEQRRIGQDLHDSLGQHLTATALAGKILAKRLTSKADAEAVTADRVVAMLESAIDLTRKLARTLDPIALGVDGLEQALQNLASSLSESFNVTCHFQYSGSVNVPDPQVSIHLYRIAQEAASNAIRHGRARHVAIALEATNRCLMLTITDDGAGLPANARAKSGMGLRIMDYRASKIGGTFDIQNLPAGGARAVCVLNPGLVETNEHANED